MSYYLLSVHAGEQTSRPDMSDAQRTAFMERIDALEAEMRTARAFVFTGGLHPASAATVVRGDGDEFLVTDGPFVEAKEHIAGFYVLDLEDLDEALRWAQRVVECIRAPIEVRPFFDGRR